MKWKFVFNSDLLTIRWGHISYVNDAAKKCGYEFFTWNGWVYNVDGERTYISVEELV